MESEPVVRFDNEEKTFGGEKRATDAESRRKRSKRSSSDHRHEKRAHCRSRSEESSSRKKRKVPRDASSTPDDACEKVETSTPPPTQTKPSMNPRLRGLAFRLSPLRRFRGKKRSTEKRFLATTTTTTTKEKKKKSPSNCPCPRLRRCQATSLNSRCPTPWSQTMET